MGLDSSTNNSNFAFGDENLSVFYGFQSSKSEDDSIKKENDNNNLEEETIGQTGESNIIPEKKIRIPVTFEWDKGGNNVYVTGNFCNWNQFFLMKKDKDGKFNLKLNLPKGIYQYKFKVDEEWEYNDKFPTCNENGIINNYIDTNNLWNEPKIIEERTNTGNSTNITDNYEFSKISKKSFLKSKNCSYLKQKIYSNYMPNKDELKEKIPELPIQYKSCININLFSNQNNIGNKKFFRITEKNILSDNFSFKNIEIIHHDQINHLNLNKRQFINNNGIYKNIISSITSRYRNKFTTFVYYKNNQK